MYGFEKYCRQRRTQPHLTGRLATQPSCASCMNGTVLVYKQCCASLSPLHCTALPSDNTVPPHTTHKASLLPSSLPRTADCGVHGPSPHHYCAAALHDEQCSPVHKQLSRYRLSLSSEKQQTARHTCTHTSCDQLHTHAFCAEYLQGTSTGWLGCCAAAVDGNSWCTMHPTRDAQRQAPSK